MAKQASKKTRRPAAKNQDAETRTAPPPATTDVTTKRSAIDAAAIVLASAGRALNAKEMIEAMAAQGLWSSPGGKTPHATLYSAILREISTKGDAARFRKAARGRFAHV